MNAVSEDAALRVFVKVAAALDRLRYREDIAFAEVLRLAQDPRHVPAAGSLPVLKRWGLTGPDGIMPDDTRAAILSSRYAREMNAASPYETARDRFSRACENLPAAKAAAQQIIDAADEEYVRAVAALSRYETSPGVPLPQYREQRAAS